ncbi:MAG: MFS transporter [Nitrospiraceae bacterium]
MLPNAPNRTANAGLGLTIGRTQARRWLLTRDFGLIWWSQVLSQVADGVSKLALLWFVYAITGSPLKTTMIGLLQTLPPIVFGPFIGVLVDRLPKKAILIVSDVTRGVLIGVVPCMVAVPHFTVGSLYMLVFLYGIATAVFVPTLSSAVPFMVPRRQFTAANALLQSTTSLGIMIGPALSGLGIALTGSQEVLCWNAVTYLASAACLTPIRLREQGAPAHRTESGSTVLRHMVDGMRYAFFTHRQLLVLIIMASVYTFGTGAFTTLFPVFGSTMLGLGPVEVGYLWSWLGVGFFLTSIGLIRLSEWPMDKRVLTIAAACLLGGASVCALTWVTDVKAAALLITCIGIGFGAWTPMAWGMIQEMAPANMLGRVMSAYTAVATATSLAGMSFFGWVTEAFGSAISVVGIGLILCCLALLSRWFSRHVHELRPASAIRNSN